MRVVVIAPGLILQCLVTALGGAQSSPPGEQPQMPSWYYSDSTWRDVSWAGGTINDRIVMVTFKEGVTPKQRASVYRRVNARAVYYEKAELDPPIFYMIEVKPDPQGLGVKRAIELLEQMPEIGLATFDARDEGISP